ncbi:putative site-specific recombinase, phage integrase family protein [Roseobacter sp. GAI101]|nr:putative site-specific recombinase, phage integrase family protein [Roseobacter sp. GAI101]
MSEKSVNTKKQIKHLRKGLSIYKTERSPYWHARVYISSQKKYVVRSTKETSRLDAAEVAEEILADLKSKQKNNHATAKDQSFEHFAQIYMNMARVQKRGVKNKYAFSDEAKILLRETDGVISYFGKYDVGKITSGMVRDYLFFLDSRRDKPLAFSTKAKQCIMIRKVLMVALEDGVIDIIPPMPKQRTKDAPRPTFTDKEYKHLMTTARRIASEGKTKVRGVLISHDHVHMWQFIVHSFVRPTETELFALRHCDIVVGGNPTHLELTLFGKTGHRISATMPFAQGLYQSVRSKSPNAEPTDYVFMSEYQNRTTAVNTARRLFNHVLEESNLRKDMSGNPRTPYSLRHYALQARLRGSKGKVNIYWLAKNAGTSVDQLERFYLKNMALSPEQIRNLQST